MEPANNLSTNKNKNSSVQKETKTKEPRSKILYCLVDHMRCKGLYINPDFDYKQNCNCECHERSMSC